MKQVITHFLAAIVIVQAIVIYNLHTANNMVVDMLSAKEEIISDLREDAREYETRYVRERAHVKALKAEQRVMGKAISSLQAKVNYLQSDEYRISKMLMAKYDLHIDKAMDFAPIYAMASDETGISPKLLAAVSYAETRFYPDRVSHKGAVGLMQIMPKWWVDELDFIDSRDDLFDVRKNVRAGAQILSRCMQRFGSIRKAIQCYHGGAGGVFEPHDSTKNYVKLVESRFMD